ncbi:polysaccharide biosynthesis/export family protein [Mucilaginibacter sp. Bleaf8]|nr:polysaccharide biosynthesis/export family protein [Mucilaginibacter sp. Bleaf8]MBS7566824.1 polysaccharide biosynthesis/export family protein [Mucilaginibacter sp. Bleaf8]
MSFLVLFFVLIVYSSCNSYKKIPYFQNLDKTRNTAQDITNYTPITIQPSDILGINVTSSNPEASAVFNYNLGSINGTANISSNNPVIGYLVNTQGELVLPLLGKVQVAGSTVSDLEVKLQKELSPYLKNCLVNVRLINFKVSVLGDVEHPGVFPVANERVTLNEAISLAGDLNITALRKVLLIREVNGKRDFIPIDLTSKDLFSSPYYYLKSNDVIYVQPGKNKFASVDNNYRTISLILSALSIAAIILTRN